MIQDFFGRSGKQPDKVTSQKIFVYAHGPGLSGKKPASGRNNEQPTSWTWLKPRLWIVWENGRKA
jgi:hypothetical protein